MAIGRISGSMLAWDLDRQGTDLQFTTNSNTLLYLNFSNFRAGINTNTPTETLTINGNISAGNVKINFGTISTEANQDLTLQAGRDLRLGSISKVKITGGAQNYVLTTDGNGNLSWTDFLTLSQEQGGSGLGILLGLPTSSLSTCAAYEKWTSNTSVSSALVDINRVMLNIAQNTFVGNVNFNANMVSGPSPLTVTFTATVTGNPNSYIWNFGDGNTITTAGPTVTHTYNNTLGGLYSVYFQAFNSNGVCGSSIELGGVGSAADITKQDYITLYTPVPIAQFTVNTTSINSGSIVGLTNNSQYATSYSINWGDTQYSNIASNTGIGSSGTTITHLYSSTTGDTTYGVSLSAISSTAGITPVTVTTAPTTIKVYTTHNPQALANTTSGTNKHLFYSNGTPNITGLPVLFTNQTASNPGNTATFTNNKYRWNWGDGTFTDINIGSANAGDTNKTITHSYVLVDPTQSQTFNANLQVLNGHSQSPFTSSSIVITVNPAPTAQFTATAVATSDRTGDNGQVGYLFTDLNGVNRANIAYTNTSYNTNTYRYNFGDGTATTANITVGQPGSPNNTLYYTFTTAGTYTQTLTATGTYSTSASDDTLTRTNYITIKNAPAAPDGLSTKTISLSSVGNSPLLAAAAQDNTGGFAPAAGASIIRFTTQNLVTSTVTSVYNAASGTLTSFINGSAEGSVTFNTSVNAGTYSTLIVEDFDAHDVLPGTYPSNFYQIFNANISKTNSTILTGVNSVQLRHSLTGNTNLAIFVKDPVTSAPTLDVSNVTMSNVGATSIKYISSIPYYENNGNVRVSGLKVYNWIGQTYLNSNGPLTLGPGEPVESTTGNITSPQTKSYAQLNGNVSYLLSGIPKANTGNVQSNSYTMGDFYVSINGNAAAVSQITANISNVNGTSLTVNLPAYINVYSTTIAGFDETAIPVSATLGTVYSDNGRRIFIDNAIGPTPVFSSNVNYYVNGRFQGAVTSIETSDEAIVRWGRLSHNNTNYSVYLPPGPNLSTRPAGTQYFRFAFRRNLVQNFTIKYSGKISGMWIAAPGTQIDSTSSLNGWLDCTGTYAGAGIPGANTAAGGNGSNFCAYDPSNRVVTGTVVNNKTSLVTLGSETSTNATGNQIFVSIALNSGDYITSLEVS